MIKIGKCFLYLIIATLLMVSCSKEESQSNNFVGKQNIVVTLDGVSYDLKGGDYYDSLKQSNAKLNFEYDDLFKTMSLSIIDGNFGIKNLSIAFFTVGLFQDYEISIGETVNDPYLFYLEVEPLGENFKYTNEIIAPFNDGYKGHKNKIKINNTDVEFTLKDKVSNGVEVVFDGKRNEYPLEKIEGKFNLKFKDENDVSHQLKIDFDAEGDNIVEGGTDFQYTPQPTNPLMGKWSQVNSCKNSNGDSNYFNFTSTTKGYVFQSDCNSTCSGLGVKTRFTYTINGSKVKIKPTSVSKYCGVSSSTPASFTESWSISGNILKIGTTSFKK